MGMMRCSCQRLAGGVSSNGFLEVEKEKKGSAQQILWKLAVGKQLTSLFEGFIEPERSWIWCWWTWERRPQDRDTEINYRRLEQ